MAYVAPSTVTAGQTYTAAAHNIIVNDIIDLNTRYAIVTSSTRPGSPTEGMAIYETDTQKVLVYSGSAWIETHDLDLTGAASTALYDRLKRVAYVERTSNYASTSTSLSGATDLFSSDLTFTAEAADYLIIFNSGSYGISSTSGLVNDIYLTDGGNNSRRRIAAKQTNADRYFTPGIISTYITLTSGSQSFNIRSVVNDGAQSFTLGANNGSGNNDMPMFLAAYGPVMT